jgi:MFS family permease
LVGGWAIGVCSAVVPVYQAEIAPKNIRGRVVSLQQWAITWGILIQFYIQYGASFYDGGVKNPQQRTAAFRIPWGIQAIPGAILFAGLFFFPRSPRWLASKDRWEEALQVLAHLHGGGDLSHPKVLAEYKEIEDALNFEREQAETSFGALVKPRILKRVILGMSIQMWSQLCGMVRNAHTRTVCETYTDFYLQNIMMYYIVFIMRGAGIADELLTASIQYIINVAMTLPAILYLDKFGRRPALLVGSFLMSLWLFLTGALQATYGHANPDTNDKDISWVVPKQHTAVSKAIVACSYLFVATFATTWGPTSWTYPSEIFPAKVRAKAVSLATASNWTWNCILAFAVPPLLFSINWKMYMIFGTFNAMAFIHMFLTAPETKGRSLEEMDEIFDRGIPAWKTSTVSSRGDQLQRDIEAGNVKVSTTGHGHGRTEDVAVEPKV